MLGTILIALDDMTLETGVELNPAAFRKFVAS
jgi:hypothetical protein